MNEGAASKLHTLYNLLSNKGLNFPVVNAMIAMRLAGQKQVRVFFQHLQYPKMHLRDALWILCIVLQATI